MNKKGISSVSSIMRDDQRSVSIMIYMSLFLSSIVAYLSMQNCTILTLNSINSIPVI